MKTIPLVQSSDFPIGSVREFVVEGQIIALFHTEEGLFATDGMCLHAGGPLAQGKVQGCIVTCPWHGWQYNLQSGEHTLTPRLKLQKFPVIEDEGVICLKWEASPE